MKRENLENVSFTRDFTSRFMKPMKLTFEQNNELRVFDLVTRHCSVATLLYHKEFQKFLVVRQFRPAVFMGKISKFPENRGKPLEEINVSSYDAELGYTVELCAGLVDKNLPVKDIAREEIEEECGYSVPEEQIHFLATFTVDADESGAQQWLYYAEIDESMRISDGGGNIAEGESITKVFLTVEEARKYMSGAESHGPPGACFAFQWWFQTNPEDRKTHTYEEPTYKWRPESMIPMQNLKFELNTKSNRYNPIRMFYTLNPITRSWDLAPCQDNVAVFVYNKQKKEIVFVQRFRPAVMVGRTTRLLENKGKEINSIGWDEADQHVAYTLEMCSTHTTSPDEAEDKAKECMKKKLGFDIDNLLYITCFITGISVGGDRQRLYYTEVNESQRVANWEQFEDVVPVVLPLDKLPSLLRQAEPFCPPGVLYMIQWFLKRQNE